MHKVPLFKGRAFVSLLMACGFFVVATSGFILYIAPHGWGGGASEKLLFGLGKREWASLHIVFSVLFPILAAVHLGLNWKPLVGYVRRKIQDNTLADGLARLRLELLAALAVCVFLWAATLMDFWPASMLLALKSALSAMW